VHGACWRRSACIIHAGASLFSQPGCRPVKQCIVRGRSILNHRVADSATSGVLENRRVAVSFSWRRRIGDPLLTAIHRRTERTEPITAFSRRTQLPANYGSGRNRNRRCPFGKPTAPFPRQVEASNGGYIPPWASHFQHTSVARRGRPWLRQSARQVISTATFFITSPPKAHQLAVPVITLGPVRNHYRPDQARRAGTAPPRHAAHGAGPPKTGGSQGTSDPWLSSAPAVLTQRRTAAHQLTHPVQSRR